MAGHTGVTSGKSARIKKLTFAPSGELFTGPDAASWGYREMASIVWEGKTVKDFSEANKEYVKKVTITHDSFQATFPALKLAYLYTKTKVICKAEDSATTDIFYFVDDPTPLTPAGSCNLGASFKYHHTVDKCILSFKAQGQMSLEQFDWQMDNVGATITGETGGATLGTTGNTFDETQFTPGNVRTFQITNSNGAGFIGSIKDFDFMFESFAEDDTDDLDRFIHNKFRYTLKCRSKNVTPAEMKEFNADAKGTTTILVTDMIGRTVTIYDARENNIFTLADNKRDAEVNCTGTATQNPDEGTPTSIVFGASSLEIHTLGLE